MDQQELIRQILDGELSADEQRQQTRLAMADDPHFEARLQRMREAQQALAALPVPLPRPGITDRIMEALPRGDAASLLERLPPVPGCGDGRVERIMAAMPPAEQPAPWWRLLLRPIPVPAWAALLLLVCAVSWIALDRPTTPAPQAKPQALASNHQQPRCPRPAPVQVRFHLAAPGAKQVSLVADFNGWSVDQTRLSDPDNNGIWTVTVPLVRGRYRYKFLVDGSQWIVDPDAPSIMADGFGGTNALLDI